MEDEGVGGWWRWDIVGGWVREERGEMLDIDRWVDEQIEQIGLGTREEEKKNECEKAEIWTREREGSVD